jgi:hypothetical protein
MRNISRNDARLKLSLAMPQITARLSPEDRLRFEKYAISFGLNGSSLARLLLLRELRVRMERPRDVVGRKRDSGYRKLTAHSCGAAIVKRLRAYAEARHVSRAEAAKLIFEHELSECWLLKAMGQNRVAEARRSTKYP